MKIAVISTMLPTQCGIAYCTDHLIAAMAITNPANTIIPVGISSPESPLSNSATIPFVIQRDDPWTYRDVFECIAQNGFSGILLQHEFGLYGGEAGCFILPDLATSNIPVVTVFHTILRAPAPRQRSIIRAIAAASHDIISPTALGVRLLQDSYGIDARKLTVIPHGVPRINAIDIQACKHRLKVDGRVVVLTYGLLSEGKGIDYAIRSMAEIATRQPAILYIVAGITHPRVRSTRGESYRNLLYDLVSELGLQQNVLFLDRSFTHSELSELLGAADFFLCPYTSQEQIVSGTISTMMAIGRPIVTTPFWHAQELIEQNAAIGVEFNDSCSITNAILWLLERPERAIELSTNARQLVENATWEMVAAQYLSIFENNRTTAIECCTVNSAHTSAFAVSTKSTNFLHVQRLTTSVGILQHCKWSIPLYNEGYCTDDNARALLLCCRRREVPDAYIEQLLASLHDRYLAFLVYAYNDKRRRFRNFLSFAGNWLEEVGSEECHARALRALSSAAELPVGEASENVAEELFVRAVPGVRELSSIRAIAIGILAICGWSRLHRTGCYTIAAEAVERVMVGFGQYADATWVWPEDQLTWFNAKLPHALIEFGHMFAVDQVLAIGLESLQWLTKIQKARRGYFEPVGANKPFCKGETKSCYDQQPIEAWATIAACRAALEATGDTIWLQEAETAFQWFIGWNSNRSVLVNSETGGCRDAVTPNGVNWNEGAESLLAWHLSNLDICATRLAADSHRRTQVIGDRVQLNKYKE